MRKTIKLRNYTVCLTATRATSGRRGDKVGFLVAGPAGRHQELTPVLRVQAESEAAECSRQPVRADDRQH